MRIIDFFNTLEGTGLFFGSPERTKRWLFSFSWLQMWSLQPRTSDVTVSYTLHLKTTLNNGVASNTSTEGGEDVDHTPLPAPSNRFKHSTLQPSGDVRLPKYTSDFYTRTEDRLNWNPVDSFIGSAVVDHSECRSSGQRELLVIIRWSYRNFNASWMQMLL